MITVFGKEWFKKYNKQLCWLANSCIGDFIFKISKMGHDKKKYGKITEMHPNAITHKQRLLYDFEKKKFEQEYTTQFFTRNEYALRLQKVFYPIWLLFHGWDMLIANPFKPAWNLGFDTLTVYPDAGHASTTVDGHVRRYTTAGESWASMVAGTSGDSAEPDLAVFSATYIVGHADTDLWRFLFRGFLLFDTSALGSGTITNAVLSLYGSSKIDNLSCTPDLDIYTSSPASNNNLVGEDFDQVGSASQTGSPITYAGFDTAGYNDFTFLAPENTEGCDRISKDGISKFSTRNANYDVSGTIPTWSENYSQIAAIAADNGSNKPKLVVTYTAVTTYTKTIQAKARIQQSDIAKTVQAKGRVKQVGIDKTIQTKADIKQTDIAGTVQAKARLKQTESKTVQSKARLKQLGVDKTVQAKARIKDTNISKTIQAKARVQQTPVKTIQSKANILGAGFKTIQAKAAVKQFGIDKTIQTKANIKQPDIAKTIQTKANILGTAIKTITAKANLWAFRSGYVKMRSRDQEYPITLNSDKDFNKLRSLDQEYPKTLEDNRIL